MLGLKTSLHELGIPRDAINTVAERLTKSNTKPVGNYVPLSEADVRAVLELAY